jgi:hypothetical protein
MDFIRNIESRHYTSFSQAAAECAASRIFLGIHWRFDAIEGVSAGDRIADIDFDTLLRPKGAGKKLTHVPTVDFAAQIDAYLNGTYLTYFAPKSTAAQGSALSSAAPSGASSDSSAQLGHALVAGIPSAIPVPVLSASNQAFTTRSSLAVVVTPSHSGITIPPADSAGVVEETRATKDLEAVLASPSWNEDVTQAEEAAEAAEIAGAGL